MLGGSSSVRTLTSDFTGAKKREEAQNYGIMIVGKIMNSKIIGGGAASGAMQVKEQPKVGPEGER